MSSSLQVVSVVARAAVASVGAADGFGQALRVANPQLADRLDTHVKGVDDSRLTRTRVAYQLRAQHRATPFGLFAGIGPVRIIETGPVTPPREPVAYLRPDSELLDHLIAAFESDPDVLLGMTVALRHPFSIHGDRVYTPPGRSVEDGFARSVRYTPVLRHVIVSLLDGPRRVEDLHATLAGLDLSRRPSTVEFAAYVGQLVGAGLLVSQLRPASSCTAPLRHVAASLRERRPGVAETLLELHRGMGLVAMSSVADRVQALRNRITTLPIGPPPGAGPAQVDTTFRQAGSVPAVLVEQAVQHACLLDRIALRQDMGTPLATWHRSMVERFGIDRPVPLLVATDPVTGIGLPRWGTAPDPGGIGHEELCRTLLRRAGSGPRAGEVWSAAIVDDDLPRDAGIPHPTRDVCLDVYYEPGGRFVLAPAVVGGCATPGAFNGRLRAALDAVTDGAATTDLRQLTTRSSRVLDFRTAQPRSGNVNRPTDIHGAALAIDHVPARPTDLTLSAVTLVATLDGVRVCDAAGEPLALSYSALLNRDSTPGIVRLLMEIAESPAPRWMPWTWGPFTALPSTPRIVHDGVIVCRSQWSIPDMVRAAAGSHDFSTAVQRWRAECAVPEVVEVSDGTDQVLPLDIACDPVHLSILEKMVTRGAVEVREDLRTELTHSWGQVDHMELVLALVNPATPETCR